MRDQPSHTVALLGALDTKAEEISFLADQLVQLKLRPLVIDFGILAKPRISADISREKVALAGGVPLAELIAKRHSGQGLQVMAKGLKFLLADLMARKEISGVLAIGGSRGLSVAATAIRDLPLGIPKIIVAPSFMNNLRALVGSSDIVVVPTVADMIGLNRIITPALSRAAHILAGWLNSESVRTRLPTHTVGLTSFGVTTPCVEYVRGHLRNRGIDVVVFPANGIGGPAMERLVEQGEIDGVIDITTHELADSLVGGTCAAPAERLRVTGRVGLPQIISLGALDIVNFAAGQVPENFRDRNLYQHSSAVTLMRTNVAECVELGRRVASCARESRGPTTVIMPAQGFSEYDRPNGAFWLPEADQACMEVIEDETAGYEARTVRFNLHINDPEFARLLVETYVNLATPLVQENHGA